MNVTTVPADSLTAEQLAAWSAWQRADAALCSPFLRPEFAQQVAAVCGNVEVAILAENGEAAGFFPFQRGNHGIGIPVGGALCDFQGVIARPGTAWNAAELIRGCGLRVWHFHHLLSSQEPFLLYHYCQSPSFYINLAEGYEAYCRERAEAGSRRIRKVLQKSRKLARDVGPIRFDFHTTDPEVFAAVIRWKVGQYRRLGAINYLAPEWTRKLLRRLVELKDEAFCGVLSALYFGDRLAAAHLGLRSYATLHGWFPVYDPDFADYSPGSLLLLKAAERAPSKGIRRIDLGRGSEGFKVSLGSAAVSVAQGSVDFRPLARALRRRSFFLFHWLGSSRLHAPARFVGRLLPRLRKWASFH